VTDLLIAGQKDGLREVQIQQRNGLLREFALQVGGKIWNPLSVLAGTNITTSFSIQSDLRYVSYSR
jgi:hypothetical protein